MQDQSVKLGLMTSAKVVIAASRLPFVLLVPVCILLSLVAIYYSFGVFEATLSGVILLGAISAHISVNLFNEYFDFKSGLDFKTVRTPFSGGSGAIPSNPSASTCVLISAIVMVVVTILCGLYLLSESLILYGHFNLSLFLIGVFGVALVLLYTGPLNRSPWLCFISPGLGFGFFMVYGTASSILGHLPLELLPVALLLFIMVNNLLLLNQLPDIEADKSIGRKHIWIMKGHKFALGLYLSTTLLIPLLFCVSIMYKIWPMLSLLALLPWCLTLFSWQGLNRLDTNVSQQSRFLATNVIATLTVPLALSVVLFAYS